MEFENYSQEMLAAETVALVIYLSPQMPWEFTYDSARHCYDETPLQAGHRVDDAPRPRLYNRAPKHADLRVAQPIRPGDPIHDVDHGQRAPRFPYRHESIKRYQALDDQLSIQYITYDMADERTHVAYGKKWIPELMAQQGIDQPVEQYIEEKVALWEREYRSGALPLHQ
ncbi:MAG: hypothetical protein R2867_35860 [Caldilineaceae bacterium]